MARRGGARTGTCRRAGPGRGRGHSPITAAASKPWRRKMASTSSAASGAQDTSSPPLVCGSVSSAWSTAAKPAGSATVAP